MMSTTGIAATRQEMVPTNRIARAGRLNSAMRIRLSPPYTNMGPTAATPTRTGMAKTTGWAAAVAEAASGPSLNALNTGSSPRMKRVGCSFAVTSFSQTSTPTPPRAKASTVVSILKRPTAVCPSVPSRRFSTLETMNVLGSKRLSTTRSLLISRYEKAPKTCHAANMTIPARTKVGCFSLRVICSAAIIARVSIAVSTWVRTIAP